MSGHRVNYCGSTDPEHRGRTCRDCRVIYMRDMRARKRVEVLEAQITELQAKLAATVPLERPICPSCKMRFRVSPEVLAFREGYNNWTINANAFKWLENAARFFDSEAGDRRFTAQEFVAWVRPDVAALSVVIPESVGRASQAGGNSPRINSADPIPYAPLPPKIRGAA